MIEGSQHAMQLSHAYDNGAEEWLCPQCGRRFVMVWKPAFKRIILQAGDETVAHSGGRGLPGVSLSLGHSAGTSAASPIERETALSEEMRHWLRDAGFEGWWRNDA